MVDFFLIDFILHVDKYIDLLLQQFGVFIYLILFGIVFLETGIVLFPLLPGDSLLFVTGTFAARGSLNIVLLFILFFTAAVLGDMVNYWLGRNLGQRVFAKSKLFKKEYLQKTQAFYQKYGSITVVFARFVPIVRTFAPFVAGIGKMNYATFTFFNVIGAFIWVVLFLLGGYFFGTIPIVQENLTLITYLIIVVSILPILLGYLKKVLTKPKAA